jgi:Tfp pilus assembly protein PilN
MGNQRQGGRRQEERRGAPDRRRAADRRRGSDPRTAAFEVCRTHLHLALVVHTGGDESNKVVTRSIPWRVESTSLYSDAGVEELTQAFRTLVTEEKLAGATVRIALGGEFCVTRVVSGSSDEVRRELAELEERSHRYLTLGPGRKILASSVQQLDARHDHALLTVANQRTLEALLAIADTVGLQLATIEPSLVALSRAQARLRGGCQDACLVIQLDAGAQDGKSDLGAGSRAELGICHGGRLLLDYRPGGHTDSTNIASIVAQHLTRVQRYLDRGHPYLKIPVRQVYLAGDPAAVVRALQQFARFKQFQVTVLDPAELDADWNVVSEPPGPELAAALGTALLDEPSDIIEQSPNLMERILSESREPMRPILIRSLLPVAAMLLVAAGLFALFLRERTETSTLRAELDALAPIRTRALELQLQHTAAETKLKHLTALQQLLPRPNWGELLARIAQSMPDDVWLDGLTFLDGQTATVTGASYADGGVYDFVNYLKQVPNVAEIALQGTGVGRSMTGPTTSFNLQLSLVKAPGRSDQESPHD